nr:hypothetical protein [Allomuricauda sp.]
MKKSKKIKLSLNKKVISELKQQKIGGNGLTLVSGCQWETRASLPPDPTVPMHPTHESRPCGCC